MRVTIEHWAAVATILAALAAITTLMLNQFRTLRTDLINYVDLKVDALDDKMTARFDAVDARFTAVDARGDGLEDKMAARFDAVDARFTTVDTRFDALDSRMDQLDQRIVEVRDDLKADIGECNRRLGVLEERTYELAMRLPAYRPSQATG